MATTLGARLVEAAPMTPTHAELRRLLAEATPGPWEADYGQERRDQQAWATILTPDGKVLFDSCNGDHVLLDDPDSEGNWRDTTGDANAVLIVAAVNELPALLDTIDALEGERERLRAALERIVTMPGLSAYDPCHKLARAALEQP